MLRWLLSVIDIWHYNDAMLEDSLAEVESDLHLVAKWAQLIVSCLIT